MSFKKYFYGLSKEERETFAVACVTSVGHLRNVAYGKPCREKLAISIERESRGLVTIESLCPDADWAYVRGTSTVNPENSQKQNSDARAECCSGDPRHGERRRPEMRAPHDRREEGAA